MKEKIKQVRNWCYTKQGEVDIEWDDSIMSYRVSEPEVAPTTNQKHYQGFIVFKTKKTLGGCKKVDNGAHWEAANGTIEQNIKYCNKEGKAEYCGSLDGCGQGCRSDLLEVARMLKAGSNIAKVVDQQTSTFIKYSNGIIKAKYFIDKEEAKTFRQIETLVYWGDTGTGKTKKALAEPDTYILNAPSNGTIWFDGYDGEKTLVLDDFYGWIKQHELLRICDGHPYHCAVKGAFTWAKWTKVIITSNKEANEWYKDGLSEAMKRRISKYVHFVIKEK